MADADMAEALRESLEAIRKVNTNPEYEPTGLCLNCEAVVPPGIRWCCVECRDDQLARIKREG